MTTFTKNGQLILALIICCFSAACTATKSYEKSRVVTTSVPSRTQAVAHALVYKTRNDYSRRVPVLMDETRTRILSYPAPSDLIINGRMMLPTPLKNGYWLDNRGIGPNVAFLKYTYEEYAQLKQVPDLNALLAAILDKDPLTELWDCGLRSFTDEEIQTLNNLIDNNFSDQKALITPQKMAL